jgi:hypothetical protein
VVEIDPDFGTVALQGAPPAKADAPEGARPAGETRL